MKSTTDFKADSNPNLNSNEMDRRKFLELGGLGLLLLLFPKSLAAALLGTGKENIQPLRIETGVPLATINKILPKELNFSDKMRLPELNKNFNNLVFFLEEGIKNKEPEVMKFLGLGGIDPKDIQIIKNDPIDFFTVRGKKYYHDMRIMVRNKSYLALCFFGSFLSQNSDYVKGLFAGFSIVDKMLKDIMHTKIKKVKALEKELDDKGNKTKNLQTLSAICVNIAVFLEKKKMLETQTTPGNYYKGEFVAGLGEFQENLRKFIEEQEKQEEQKKQGGEITEYQSRLLETGEVDEEGMDIEAVRGFLDSHKGELPIDNTEKVAELFEVYLKKQNRTGRENKIGDYVNIIIKTYCQKKIEEIETETKTKSRDDPSVVPDFLGKFLRGNGVETPKNMKKLDNVIEDAIPK